MRIVQVIVSLEMDDEIDDDNWEWIVPVAEIFAWDVAEAAHRETRDWNDEKYGTDLGSGRRTKIHFKWFDSDKEEDLDEV